VCSLQRGLLARTALGTCAVNANHPRALDKWPRKILEILNRKDFREKLERGSKEYYACFSGGAFQAFGVIASISYCQEFIDRSVGKTMVLILLLTSIARKKNEILFLG
jgi:hypothetical protein